MRQEIGLQRTQLGDDPRRPGWSYPYQSLESEADEMTPAQMRERGRAAIEAAKAKMRQ